MRKIVKLTESNLVNLVKRIISEQEEISYTTKFDATFENASDQTRPELKIFEGAKFVKNGDVLVADTKYQFVDSRTGVKIGYGPKDALKFEYTGKVTYNCAEGKFTVNASKFKYFQEYGELTKALSPLCKRKSVPSNPNVVKNVVNNAGKLPIKSVGSNAPKLSGHMCDQTTGNVKLFTGKSYKYCMDSQNQKYYFKGTQGEPLQKFPDWTEATGSGLESIKSKVFFDR
jgi:hypothetical protein